MGTGYDDADLAAPLGISVTGHWNNEVMYSPPVPSHLSEALSVELEVDPRELSPEELTDRCKEL